MIYFWFRSVLWGHPRIRMTWDWESKWQPANLGLSGKSSLKWCECECVYYHFHYVLLGTEYFAVGLVLQERFWHWEPSRLKLSNALKMVTNVGIRTNFSTSGDWAVFARKYVVSAQKTRYHAVKLKLNNSLKTEISGSSSRWMEWIRFLALLLHSMVGYWHKPVVCPSVRLSVCDAVRCGSHGRCAELKVVPAC